MNMNEEFGLPWHADGKLLYTENNDFIGEMEHSDDARFVCDAVNNAPLFDILQDDHKELMHDVDRLRAELADKTRNYEDVIAFHTRTEESLRDLVRRMLPFVEKCHSDALGLSKTIKGICALKGVDTSEIDRINSEHDALIAEARAAIGEDAK